MSLPLECPLCFSGSNFQNVVTSHVFGIKYTEHAFFHCNKCDVYYQFPGLTLDEELKFYTEEFEGFMTSRSGESGGWNGAEKHIEANITTFKRRYKYLSEIIPNNANILEIGCSSGFMLYPYINKGHKCFGIEPSGVFSEYVKNRGIPVFSSLDDFKSTNKKIKFDIIFHFFVLEHISNPIKFLEDQIELLNPGGKIIFEIPNVNDALYKVYDIPEFERFYWSLAHPWYFSEKSLNYLLDKTNLQYEIKLDQRYDLSNHMTWARDGKPGGMGKFTSLIGLEIEELYKQELIKTRFCDTLIGIITKNNN